jgi:hypothetical protein
MGQQEKGFQRGKLPFVRIHTRPYMALWGVIILAAIFILNRHHQQQVTLPVAFGGLTNSAGAKYAILHFPSVRESSPRKTFFWRPTYWIELDLVYSNRDGSSYQKSIQDIVGLSSRLPLGAAEIRLPLDTNVASITSTRAKGILDGYTDNKLFGMSSPFFHPRGRWDFSVPRILNAQQE